MALALSQGQGSGLPVEKATRSITSAWKRHVDLPGLKTWPHDALRHSFCSYHYAKHNDAGKTMAQAGHTNPRTFFRHYRARVQSLEAERFFGIRPRWRN